MVSAVRKLEVEEYLVQKKYDKAIDILVESKELDKEYPGLLAEYSKKLIALYQELNMDEEYKNELLKEERLYKRLLDEILKSGYVYSLNQYEKCLKKEFPNEVRDAYVNYSIRSAESATDRKAYNKVITY